MKNLLYKELKLAWHPIVYVFIVAFPFMVLIPSYPIWIGYIYVCSCYPILFLGANKGQQSNDIIYTALLPVRKKDIVLARILSLVLMLGITIVLSAALTPLAIYTRDLAMASSANDLLVNNPTFSYEEALTSVAKNFNAGLPHEAFLSLTGFTLIAFAFYNYLFLTWFYKNGRSILFPSLAGIFGFIIFLTVFAIILPLFSSAYMAFFLKPIVQVVTFVIGLIVYFGLLYLAYIVSSKELEKVDL